MADGARHSGAALATAWHRSRPRPAGMVLAHPANVMTCRALGHGDYWIGACVGRGSVIGFGVGSVGAVDGEGDGLTVFTDGPALVVSPIRVGVLGNNIAIKTTTMAAANTIGSSALPRYRGDG
jgi:hypothetical protein